MKFPEKQKTPTTPWYLMVDKSIDREAMRFISKNKISKKIFVETLMKDFLSKEKKLTRK